MTNGENHRLGAYVEASAGGERVRAYLPAPLPPDPPLELGRFMQVYERAIAAVGRLDGVTTILPSTPLFLYMYVRKEALLSSQSDLLLFENHAAPTDVTAAVCNSQPFPSHAPIVKQPNDVGIEARGIEVA